MSKTNNRRLFIIDPSLKDFQGHHFTLTKNVSLSAQHIGFEVIWICSKSFKVNESKDLPDVSIRPVFKNSMYDAYMKTPDTAGVKSKSTVSKFADTIIETLQADGVTGEDRVLFHTADGVTYLALPLILNGLKSKSPIIHICTPYDPVGVMPNRKDAKQISDVITKLKSKKRVDRRVYFYGENELLSAHLSKLWKIPVHTLNLPANQYNIKFSKTDLIQYRRLALGIKPNTFLCTYLGSARLEKGYHYLPYIISRLFEFGGADVPIHFAVQSSPQVIGYHQTIKNAIVKMKTGSKGHVSLLEEVMSNEEYSKLLHASDLIILPYELEKYRVRGSGIVSEAIECGKIVVGTRGTYPGFMGERYSGGSADTPINFAKKILEIFGERQKYEMNAKACALEFVENNNYEHYFYRCLATENI